MWGEDLKKRFGLPYWQFTLTATDANRFSVRIAREITQRAKILVFHYCYHGTVDETFAGLQNGVVRPRRGNIGPPVSLLETTRVVEFNDLNAFEDALKHHDVACILAEPAMTKVGIILPEKDYWKQARELAWRYGALFIADETHTICAGPGGCTTEWSLRPDILVFGKAIGKRDSRRGVWLHGRSCAADHSADLPGRLRRRWNWWHAGRERVVTRRDARDIGAGTDDKEFREDDRAGGTV